MQVCLDKVQKGKQTRFGGAVKKLGSKVNLLECRKSTGNVDQLVFLTLGRNPYNARYLLKLRVWNPSISRDFSGFRILLLFKS